MNVYKNFLFFFISFDLFSARNPVAKNLLSAPLSVNPVRSFEQNLRRNNEEINKAKEVHDASAVSVKERVEQIEAMDSQKTTDRSRSSSIVSNLSAVDKKDSKVRDSNIIQEPVKTAQPIITEQPLLAPRKQSYFQKINEFFLKIKPQSLKQKKFEDEMKKENTKLWEEKDREVNLIFDVMRRSAEDINKYVGDVTFSKNPDKKIQELNEDISKLNNILKDYPDKIGYKKELTILDKESLLKHLTFFKDKLDSYRISPKNANSSKKQSITERILPKKILEKAENLKNNIWFSSLRVEKQFDEIQKNIKRLESELSTNKRTSLIKDILEKYEKFNQKRPEKSDQINSNELEVLRLNINLMKLEIIPKNKLEERKNSISSLEEFYGSVNTKINNISSSSAELLKSKLIDIHRMLMAEKQLYQQHQYQFDLKSKKDVIILDTPYSVDEVFTKNIKELGSLNDDQIKILNDILKKLNEAKVAYIAHSELFLIFKRDELIKKIEKIVESNSENRKKTIES